MLKISLPITLVLLMAVMLTAQAKKASQQQTIFFEGDKCFEHSSPLSADVLRVLLETREGKGALENSGDLDAAARMFRAVEVHLANQEQIDLLVEGVFPLTGADQGCFGSFVQPVIIRRLFSSRQGTPSSYWISGPMVTGTSAVAGHLRPKPARASTVSRTRNMSSRMRSGQRTGRELIGRPQLLCVAQAALEIARPAICASSCALISTLYSGRDAFARRSLYGYSPVM